MRTDSQRRRSAEVDENGENALPSSVSTPKRDLEVLDPFLVDAENAYLGGSGINRLCSAPLMRHFHLFATTARDCYIAATQSGCALARSSRQEPA